MKQVQCGLWSLGLLLMCCAMPRQAASEDLLLPIDLTQWKIANHSESNAQRVVEWSRPGETIDHWTELVTLETTDMELLGGSTRGPTADSPSPQLEAAAETVHRELATHFKDLTWNVIKRDAVSILYEYRILDSSSEPDQHAIARLIEGKFNLFRVEWVIKARELPSAKRTEWIGILSGAQIVTS